MPSIQQPTRSVSLNYRKNLFSINNGLKKKTRPSTWTCHRRYTVSPRVSRWVSQHNQRRLTVATISTLTSETTILADESHHDQSIFHTQSLLFLFGFLYFPCWWIGGYYLKVDLPDLERPIHPSLLANGKTTSRLLWHDISTDNLLFYHWNRCMSLVSILLLILETSLIIWYYVAY